MWKSWLKKKLLKLLDSDELRELIFTTLKSLIPDGKLDDDEIKDIGDKLWAVVLEFFS